MKEEKAKKVVIIAGPNGSGKTTLSEELLKDQKMKFINADIIAKELNPEDVNSVSFKSGKIFLRNISEKIETNQSFAIESTLAGSYLIKIIKRLKEKNYKISLIYLFLDNPDISIQRIAVRVRKGGHHISDDYVIRRFYRSKKKFWNTYRKLVDDWQLFYNGGEFLVSVASGMETNYEVFDKKKFVLFWKDILW